MGEGTGRNTESTVFPTDESMYGAHARTVQPLCGRRPHCRCIALSPMISSDAGSSDDERL